MKNHIFNKKLCACISLSLALSMPFSSSTFAQDDAVDLEKIQVTGSRIRQVQIEGIEPTQTISREDIDRSGLTSVGDILQQLTQSGSAINTRFNSYLLQISIYSFGSSFYT